LEEVKRGEKYEKYKKLAHWAKRQGGSTSGAPLPVTEKEGKVSNLEECRGGKGGKSRGAKRGLRTNRLELIERGKVGRSAEGKEDVNCLIWAGEGESGKEGDKRATPKKPTRSHRARGGGGGRLGHDGGDASPTQKQRNHFSRLSEPGDASTETQDGREVE